MGLASSKTKWPEKNSASSTSLKMGAGSWRWNSMKLPEHWDPEGFWISEHTEVLGGWHLERALVYGNTSSHTLSYASLPFGCAWVVSLQYASKHTYSLEFHESFSQMFEPKRALGTLIYSQSVKDTRDQMWRRGSSSVGLSHPVESALTLSS